MSQNRLASDLQHIVDHTRGLWSDVCDGRLFLTGGAGFFGCWFVESFLFANEVLNLNASIVVLTRSTRRFAERLPHLKGAAALSVLEGDIRDFTFPKGEFSHLIHAATEVSPIGGPLDSLTVFDRNVEGTRRLLEFAASHETRRFLFTSSGAVYGRQPPDLRHIPEAYSGAPCPLDPTTAYGQSKRVSEFLCVTEAAAKCFEAVVARCFAFVGPRLPLDASYAIGNFTRDALAGGPIHVAGDGTPYRSYLYAADLMIWLWTLLFRGESGAAYNVGSDDDLTISSLAQIVAEVINPQAEIVTARMRSSDAKPQRYVPSIDKARGELGLRPWIDLREGIRRMASWNHA